MQVREQVKAAVGGVRDDVLQLQEQLRALERTRTEGDRRVAKAERELRKRAGGLDERRHERTCVRRRVCSVADAAARARAVRRRASVREAADELARVRQQSAEAVATQRAEVARAAAAVGAHGALGAALSGVDPGVLAALTREPQPGRVRGRRCRTRSVGAGEANEQLVRCSAIGADQSRMSLDRGEDR
jgi:chromosome segregation ATPase